MSGDVYWDVDLAWDVSDTLSVTFGGNYAIDAAPDPPPFFAGLLRESVQHRYAQSALAQSRHSSHHQSLLPIMIWAFGGR